MEQTGGRRGSAEKISPAGQVIYDEFKPSFDWTQDSNCHVLLVDLPGFKKEEVTLQVDSLGRVTVSGERRVTQNRSRRFKQEFSLPKDSDIEKISGKFDSGLLFVRIPKKAVPRMDEAKDKEGAKEDKEDKKHAKPDLEEKPKEDDKPGHGRDVREEKKEESKRNKEQERMKGKENKEESERKGEKEERKRAEEKKEEIKRNKEQEGMKREEKKEESKRKGEKEERKRAEEKKEEIKRNKEQEGMKREEKKEESKRKGEKEERKRDEENKEESKRNREKEGIIKKIEETRWNETLQLSVMEMYDNMRDKLCRNKGIVVTAVIAFSVGFFISQKIRSARQ